VVDSVESIRRLLCQTCLSRFFVAAAGFNRWYPCQPHGFQMSPNFLSVVQVFDWLDTKGQTIQTGSLGRDLSGFQNLTGLPVTND